MFLNSSLLIISLQMDEINNFFNFYGRQYTEMHPIHLKLSSVTNGDFFQAVRNGTTRYMINETRYRNESGKVYLILSGKFMVLRDLIGVLNPTEEIKHYLILVTLLAYTFYVGQK